MNPTHLSRGLCAGLVVIASIASAEQAAPSAGLTAEELSVEAPQAATAPADAQSKRLSLYAEAAYLNAEGELVVDLLEQDYAYFSLSITDAQGMPVAGVTPKIQINGKSRVIDLDESETGAHSNEYGQFDFAVMGGAMGLDTLSIEAAGETTLARLNVISLKAAGFASPDEVDGVVPWTELTRATVGYTEDGVTATFPAQIAALDGTRVTLAGFMLPLEAQRRQNRFVLTSSPPSCFFHVPGGPSGAAEVLAPDGIEVTWDLVVLEGVLKTLQSSEQGVVYQLLDAQLKK